jgi:hypothetical protein
MARKVGPASDPALAIEFFLSGFYTYRSQLFAPFKGIGVNVVSFHDPVIDGANMEDIDLFEWQRRPGYSIYCSQPLASNEVVNEFYSMRNLNGQVISFFDSTTRLATFTPTTITSVIPKTGSNEGFITSVENMVYFSDGVSVDTQKWDSALPFSSINPSTWGLTAPTLTPTIFSQGCWLPFVGKNLNNAILDPNGNVEVVTKVYGASGVTGANQPLWPTTVSSTINDGSVQWTNMGPLETWLPATFFPVPVVVLDTNGNLQLAQATSPAVLAWSAATPYTVGITVSFAGEYWTSLAANTGVAPSANYTVTAGGVTQPYWVQAQNPSQTGIYPTTPYVPAWNQTVGGTTTDGNYTWINLGPGNLVESFGTSYVYCFRTIYGHLTTASPVSLNTGSIFGPVVATITGFSIAGNTVTFLGVNNFIPGNVFSVQGLTTGVYLNNQPFTVLAAGLSPTQFSAVFDFPNVGATIDSGSTENLIAAITGVGTTSPLCNAVVAISATSVLDGVVTVFSVNNFVPGLQVTFAGLTVATFLNGLQFEIINVDPLGQWFQVFFTNALGVVPPNQSQTTDTGTATFNAIEIYRTSDGGGIYLFTGAVTNPTGSTTIPFDSGISTAGVGTDNGIPGTFVWVNPNNVTSATLYATVTVPTPVGSGSGRFSAVQTCQNISSGFTAPSVSATFPANVTAGNSLLVHVVTYDLTSWTIGDNQGNVYVQIAQQVAPNDHGVVTDTVYKVANPAAGPTTVKLTPVFTSDNNDFFGFQAVECSGLNGTVEAPASVFQASGTTLNSGTITTSATATVVFSFIWSDLSTNSGNVATQPAAYLSAGNQTVFDAADGNTFQQMAVAYQVQSATGTFSPIWATPANSKGIGITIALDLSLFAPSDGLNAEQFNFSVPPAIAVAGITIEFDSFFTGTPGFGILDVQLLNAGNPVGTVMQVALTNAVQTYTLGGPTNLWGTTWTPTNFNSSAWGVQFTATQLTGGTNATFSVRNVRARLVGGTSTTGWVFNDFTTDANLDILQIAPQNHLNDPPPGAPGSSVNQVVGTLTAYWQGRIWMCVGNFVYFDAGPDCVNGVPEESWPPANRFQFVGPTLGLEPTADGVGLLVYLADRVNAILGGPETISFYATDALNNFGISNPNAIFKDGSTIGQFTTQKQYFELIESQKIQVGEHIADYLTANFSPLTTFATMHRNGLDVGVFLSNGVDRIVRYGSNISAWSVPAFPIGGAGALRSIETAVGTYSLMLGSPTGGATVSTSLTNPSVGASVGTGVAWLTPGNITAGNPTSYATVTLSSASVVPSENNATNGFTPTGATAVTTITPVVTPINVGDTAFMMFYVQNEAGNSDQTIISGITDNLGNNWQLLFPTQNPSAHLFFQVFYARMGTAVPLLSTLTITAAVAFHTEAVVNYASFANFTNLGALNSTQQRISVASTDPVSGPAITITQQEFLMSFVFVYEGNIPLTGPTGWTQDNTNFGHPNTSVVSDSAAWILEPAGTYADQWTSGGSADAWGANLAAFIVPATVPSVSQSLQGSQYPLNIPPDAIVQGVEVSITGKTTNTGITMSVTPANAAVGAEADAFSLTASNTTQVFGGPLDLWGMSAWLNPSALNAGTFGFNVVASAVGISGTVSISEVQVAVFYTTPGSYLRYRDTTTWADNGLTGQNNGTSYSECYITVGSITLSQPGAPMFPLQHVVGYFDAVGTLHNGGSSWPDIWILPNEVSDTKGIGFVFLPETLQEPPVGQNKPSTSLLALRWPVNMMNSDLASQYVHHLQVKISFDPENAPNTIKAISFKENQSD